MMKKVIAVVGFCFLLFACNESSTSTKITVDSTVDKLDSAADKIGEKAKAGWDTIKSKAKDVKEGLDETFDKDKKDK